jgi:hypothetical protein
MPPNKEVCIMMYLVIGLISGFVIDRYLFPIFDMLLETLQYKITNKCTSIQIDTNLQSLEYEQLVNSGNELSPAIGFVAGGSYDEEFEEEDDDENTSKNKSKIGFSYKH